MDQIEIKAKESNTKHVLQDNAENSNKSVFVAPKINIHATAHFIQGLSASQDNMPESFSKSVNSLKQSLNIYLKDPQKIDKAPIDSTKESLSTYNKLSYQVIARDSNLQDRVAQNLSTSKKLVRSRDAIKALENSFNNLPAALKEGTVQGQNLSKFVLECLVNLTDSSTMGAGLERDLAMRKVYIREQKLNTRATSAVAKSLAQSIAFIESNQKEVIERLPKNEVVLDKPGSTTPQSMTHYLRKALNEFPDDSTYLDIFKQNRNHTEIEPYDDKVSEEISSRIHTLIAKAAQTARRGNLIPNAKDKVQSDKKLDTNIQATKRTFSKQISPSLEVDPKVSARELSLSELSARAAKLQQQFRQERMRLVQEGKLPNPATMPENFPPKITAKEILDKTLSPKTPAETLQEARDKALQQAILESKAQDDVLDPEIEKRILNNGKDALAKASANSKDAIGTTLDQDIDTDTSRASVTKANSGVESENKDNTKNANANVSATKGKENSFSLESLSASSIKISFNAIQNDFYGQLGAIPGQTISLDEQKSLDKIQGQEAGAKQESKGNAIDSESLVKAITEKLKAQLSADIGKAIEQKTSNLSEILDDIKATANELIDKAQNQDNKITSLEKQVQNTLEKATESLKKTLVTKDDANNKAQSATVQKSNTETYVNESALDDLNDKTYTKASLQDKESQDRVFQDNGSLDKVSQDTANLAKKSLADAIPDSLEENTVTEQDEKINNIANKDLASQQSSKVKPKESLLASIEKKLQELYAHENAEDVNKPLVKENSIAKSNLNNANKTVTEIKTDSDAKSATHNQAQQKSETLDKQGSQVDEKIGVESKAEVRKPQNLETETKTETKRSLEGGKDSTNKAFAQGLVTVKDSTKANDTLLKGTQQKADSTEKNTVANSDGASLNTSLIKAHATKDAQSSIDSLQKSVVKDSLSDAEDIALKTDKTKAVDSKLSLSTDTDIDTSSDIKKDTYENSKASSLKDNVQESDSLDSDTDNVAKLKASTTYTDDDSKALDGKLTNELKAQDKALEKSATHEKLVASIASANDSNDATKSDTSAKAITDTSNDTSEKNSLNTDSSDSSAESFNVNAGTSSSTSDRVSASEDKSTTFEDKEVIDSDSKLTASFLTNLNKDILAVANADKDINANKDLASQDTVKLESLYSKLDGSDAKLDNADASFEATDKKAETKQVDVAKPDAQDKRPEEHDEHNEHDAKDIDSKTHKDDHKEQELEVSYAKDTKAQNSLVDTNKDFATSVGADELNTSVNSSTNASSLKATSDITYDENDSALDKIEKKLYQGLSQELNDTSDEKIDSDDIFNDKDESYAIDSKSGNNYDESDDLSFTMPLNKINPQGIASSDQDLVTQVNINSNDLTKLYHNVLSGSSNSEDFANILTKAQDDFKVKSSDTEDNSLSQRQKLVSDIMGSTRPADEFVDNEVDGIKHTATKIEPKFDEIDGAKNNDKASIPNTEQEHDSKSILKNALTSPAASVVTTGLQEELPENTQIQNLEAVKEGGIFSRFFSLFKKSKDDSVNTNTQADSSTKTSATTQSVLSNSNNSSSLSINNTLDKMIESLKSRVSDPNLPVELQQKAYEYIDALQNPIDDLTTVKNYLNFVTGPMSPSSSQALALHQWAFFILCLRFEHIGKNVSKFLRKDLSEDEIESLLEKAPKDLKNKVSASLSASLIDDTLSQVERLQNQTQNSENMIVNRYIPLPPNYDGGREGSVNIQHEDDKDGKRTWHLNFTFDLKDLGPIAIRASAKLPELELSFVTENINTLQKVQELLPELTYNLQQAGITTRNTSARLGHVNLSDSKDIAVEHTRRNDGSQVSINI